MRFANWAPLVLLPVSASACAGQNSETDRHVKELEVRLKQLSTQSDRMEDRLEAVEYAYRSRTNAASKSPDANPTRPDLPTVKMNPSDSAAPPPAQVESTSETASDDPSRLMIVGEGSRVETRIAGDTSSSSAASPAGKSNSRAPKRIQGNVPTTSNAGAPK